VANLREVLQKEPIISLIDICHQKKLDQCVELHIDSASAHLLDAKIPRKWTPAQYSFA
jgi:hypothetical protein